MGGIGSGLNRTNPNGAVITALDEARWRLIEAEENEKKCSEHLGRAYRNQQVAEKELALAIADLTQLQKVLGDHDVTDREVHRESTGLTVAVLNESLHRAVREKRKTA